MKEEEPFCEKCVRKVPLLSSDRDTLYDIVVVGGGLAGCWTAYWLSRRAPKSKIAVVERRPDISGADQQGDIRGEESWGSGASMVNAGSLSGGYDGEGVSRASVWEIARVKASSFVRRAVGRVLGERVYWGSGTMRYDDIGVAMPNSTFSFAFLCSFWRHTLFPIRDPETFSYSKFFQNIEEISIQWYRDLAGEMKDSLGASFAIYSGRVISSKHARNTLQRKPSVDFPWIDGKFAEFFPKDISLNSDRFLRIFHTYLMKKNVTFYYDTDVTDIVTSNGQVTGLRTSKGNLVATSMYVFCTGASFHPIMNRWTSPGWGLCREYEYVSKGNESLFVMNTTTLEEPHYLYVVPRGKTGIRVTSGFLLSPSPPSSSQLQKFANAIDSRTRDALSPDVMKNLRLSSFEIHYGGRPVCPDGRPVIGPHPDLRNAYVLNGLGMYGHSSAEFSRILCDMMTGRLSELERNYGCFAFILSPSRFTFGDRAVAGMSVWKKLRIFHEEKEN